MYNFNSEKWEIDWEEIGAEIGAVLFVGLCLTALTLPLWGEYVRFHFNHSTCSVIIDNKNVYSGYCHFVNVDPVGEYGQSKKVTIYKDVIKWHVQQIYISDKVELKEVK